MKRFIIHGDQEENDNRERYSRYKQNRQRDPGQMAESINGINENLRDTIVKERMIR